jgi:excisionase family DNA binding protein
MSGLLDWLSPTSREELIALMDERVAQALRSQRSGRRWFTVAQTAEYLGVSERAIRARIARGRIPVRKQGRSLLVDREALDRLIEAGRAVEDSEDGRL